MLSIGGSAILIISIWQFVVKKPVEAFTSSLLIFIVVTAHIQIGYFFRLGNFILTIPDALLILNGTMAGVIALARPRNAKVSIAEVSFSITILLGVFALIVNPYQGELVPLGVAWISVYGEGIRGTLPKFSSATLIYILRIMLFILILRLIIYERDRILLSKLVEKFVVYSTPFIFIYFLELILKRFANTNIILDTGNQIFGQAGSQLNFLLERGGVLALQGFTLEPNFLTQSILVFGLAYLFCLPKESWIRAAFVLLYPLLAFSGSFQAILVALTLLGLSLQRAQVIEFLILVVIMAIIFILTISSFLLDGLASYFNERALMLIGLFRDYDDLKYGLIYNSEVVRVVSIVENIKLSWFNVFLGVGLGSTYAYGFVSTALSNIGVAGFVAWLFLMRWFFKKLGYKISTGQAMLLVFAFLFIGNMHLLYYPVNIILGIAATRRIGMNKTPGRT